MSILSSRPAVESWSDRKPLLRRAIGRIFSRRHIHDLPEPSKQWRGLETLEPRLLLSASLYGVDDPDDGNPTAAIELFNLSPALFVENQGQWADESVRYLHQGDGANIAMTDTGPVFQVFRTVETDSTDDSGVAEGFPGDRFADREPPEREMRQFSAGFVNAHTVTPIGLERSDAVFNYYLGDVENHRSNVPGYEIVAYEGLYEGIDLHMWGQRSNIKYEFLVAPGSDWTQIQVRYEGIEGLAINDAGELVVNLGDGWDPLVDAAPYVYQDIDGQRVEVTSRYVLVDEWTYSFELGEYDADHVLVIDPYLAWSTYLGGSGWDQGRGIAVDGSGNALVTGFTGSINFAGAINPYPWGSRSAFVSKMTGNGILLWSTYLGGSNYDEGEGIAVDDSGNALVTGYTESTNFAGAINPYPGDGSAFVSKVTGNGTLLWSTYLGGSGSDRGFDIAVDGAGNALVTGGTISTNFAGAINPYPGGWSAFVSKVTGNGTLLWSTYLGGSGTDWGRGIAVDRAGNALVTGLTTSTNFTGAINPYPGGGGSAFVSKVTGNGTLLWSTYLGGSGFDYGLGIAVDGSGNALVTGYTESTNFAGAINPYPGGGHSAFVAKVNGTLLWSTYLGGSGFDYGRGIAVDGSDNALVTGNTSSTNFAGAINTYPGGGHSAFVAKVTGNGTLARSTYLGGSGTDIGRGIAVDGSGNALVTGETTSSNFAKATNPYPGGGYSAFVAKIGTSGNGGSDELEGEKLGLFGLLSDSDFIFNAALNRYEVFDTTIYFGPALSADGTFRPLIRIEGDVWYNQSVINANGVVYTSVGGIDAPLFSGMVEFDLNDMRSTTLSEVVGALPNQYTFAGIDLAISRLEFVLPQGEPASSVRLEIEGSLTLPPELGGISVVVAGNNRIVLDAGGVSLSGAGLAFPNVEFSLPGGLNAKATGLYLEYSHDPAAVTIQGALDIEIIPGAARIGVDFAGDNFIRISRQDGVEVVGSISASDIVIVPNVWEIKSAVLTINRSGGDFTISGDALVVIPPGIEVAAGLGFINGRLNYLSLGADDLNQPIGTTGAFLQAVNGSINYIAEPTPIALAGGMGITAGPEISFSLPWYLPWSGFSGALIRIDVDGLLDRHHLEGTGTVTIVGGLAEIEAIADLNWSEGYLSAYGVLNVLDGFISADADLWVDSGLNVSLSGTASVTIPDRVPFIGGRSSEFAHYVLEFSNDGDYSNDFVAGWFDLPLLGTRGYRVSFDGQTNRLNDRNLERMVGVQATSDGMDVDGMSGASDEDSGVFLVNSDTNWIALSAEWEIDNPDVTVVLIRPDGTVLTEAAFAMDESITLVEELLTPTRRVVHIASPDQGVWELEVSNAAGLGEVSYYGIEGLDGLSVSVESVSGGQDRDPVQVSIQAHGIDGDPVRASLYYSKGSPAFSGVRVAEAWVAPDGTLTLEWDVSTMLAGEYGLYVMVDDGRTAPAFAMASESLVITSDTLVEARHLFYNNSAHDGGDAGHGRHNDDAIFPGSVAALPGQVPTGQSVSSYLNGINGVMVDVSGLLNPHALTAADFVFEISPDGSGGSWSELLSTVSIAVREGAGMDNSDRIELIWPDGVIQDTWLRITVLRTMQTGLQEPDVFYFRHVSGDVDGSGVVDDADLQIIQNTLGSSNSQPFGADLDGDGRVSLYDAYLMLRNYQPSTVIIGDINQDGVVDGLDLLIIQDALGTSPANPPEADLDGDGKVSLYDAYLLLRNYQPGGAESTSTSILDFDQPAELEPSVVETESVVIQTATSDPVTAESTWTGGYAGVAVESPLLAGHTGPSGSLLGLWDAELDDDEEEE